MARIKEVRKKCIVDVRLQISVLKVLCYQIVINRILLFFREITTNISNYECISEKEQCRSFRGKRIRKTKKTKTRVTIKHRPHQLQSAGKASDPFQKFQAAKKLGVSNLNSQIVHKMLSENKCFFLPFLSKDCKDFVLFSPTL